MKTAIYIHRETGHPFAVEYDENAPCLLCGLPVISASMSGTVYCPWCDLGVCRFDKEHRVDTEWDYSTGKIGTPKLHYERFHTDKLQH